MSANGHAARHATPTLDLLRGRRREFPPALRRIADYVLENPQLAFKMSTTELARETGTRSESTIVRFYRTLDFTSYHEFKVALAMDVGGDRVLRASQEIGPEDSTATLLSKYFAGAEQMLRINAAVLDPAVVERAVELLEGARQIHLIGQAASSAITLDAYYKFTVLGLRCSWSADPHVNAVALSALGPDDVIFCVSHSGESLDVVEPVRAAKSRAKIIAVTESPRSPLGTAADVVLPVVTEEMNYRTDAVIARVVQTCIVGTLFLALLVRSGEEGQRRVSRARQSVSHLKY